MHIDVRAYMLLVSKLVTQCLTLVFTKNNRISLYIYHEGLAGWFVDLLVLDQSGIACLICTLN